MPKVIAFRPRNSGQTASGQKRSQPYGNVPNADDMHHHMVEQLRDRMVIVVNELETLRQQLTEPGYPAPSP